jgi:hypothetical protein
MRRIVWAIIVMGAVGTIPAAAQTVISQPAPLDSARAALRNDLAALRDSLHTVDGAAARLQRDYRTASDASLLSRARLMKDACARSSRTVPSTRQAVLDFRPQLERSHRVVAALDSLHAALRRCETQFTAMSQPNQGDSVRGYANSRAEQVQMAIRNYEKYLHPYLGSLGIRLLPPGMESKASR